MTEFWAWMNGPSTAGSTLVGTLIGSLLGFIALLAGALFNARLNRQRDDRLRDQERAGVSIAIRAELVAIERALEKNVVQLRSNPPVHGGIVIPSPAMHGGVFEALRSKISHLGDADAIVAVVDAYTVLFQFRDHLILAGAVPHEAADKENTRLYIEFTKHKFVANLYDIVRGFLKTAIDRLPDR